MIKTTVGGPGGILLKVKISASNNYISKIRNKLIIRAFVISIRKAETKGTITNALYAVPYLRVIADMLAIAVGVAPSDMPPNPEHTTADS